MPQSRSKGSRHPVFRVPNPGRSIPVPISISIGCPNYTSNIWDRLPAYAADGRFPIDNNPVEQMIRLIALGRNNWLFFGSERGGRAAANLMSLVATCKRAGVKPFAYLKYVFRRLPAAQHDAQQLRALMPDVWQPA
jgi:hypothetical protein